MEKLTLISVLLPGVIAAVFVIASVLLPRTFNACGKRDWAENLLRSALGALAVGVGFLVSFHFQEGLPEWPPRERWHWLALMAGGAAVVGCLHGLWPRHGLGRIITGIMLALVAAFMLQPLAAFENPWVWKAGLSAAVFALWIGSDTLAMRRPGHVLPLAMMLAFTAASIVLIAGVNSAKYGVLAGSLACMAGAIMVIGMVASKLTIAGGATAVMATLLPAWMVTGHFYDINRDVPIVCFAMIAFAPLAMWIGEMPMVNRWGGWKAWSVRIGAVAIVLGIAAAIVIINAPPPLEPYEY